MKGLPKVKGRSADEGDGCTFPENPLTSILRASERNLIREDRGGRRRALN